MIFCFLSCSESPSQGAVATGVAFDINGTLTNAVSDSIGLYDMYGGEYIVLQKVALTKANGEARFVLKGKAPSEGVYFLGTNIEGQTQNGSPILLGSDKKIVLQADDTQMYGSLQIVEGKENTEFASFLRKTDEMQRLVYTARMQFQQAAQQQDQPQMIVEKQQVDSLFNLQINFQKQYTEGNKLINKVARSYVYIPYGMGDTQQKYATEQEYFVKDFLGQIDLKDPVNGYIPVFFQKANAYASTMMGQYKIEIIELKKNLQRQLDQIPNNTKAEEVFLLGIMSAAAQNQQSYPDYIDVYVSYAKQYVEQFPNSEKAALFASEIQKLGSTLIGSEAPDLKLKSPDGKEIALSSLKGKVVLIDFWASWCGPCRRENPNVVRVYNQYKDKGFTVYSVSLDKEMDKWKQAITQDNLAWPNHVSDLEGWQSDAAKAYGVSAIPKTFLIDSKGMIIGKDLRGEQLEQKLAEIYAK